MSSPMRGRLLCVALGLVSALVFRGAATAQSEDTVWTEVVGDGSSIYLTWHRRHPWSALLAAGGTQLVANYPGRDGRMVAEPISNGVPTDDYTLRFAMPDALRSDPRGGVCLTFRAPNSRLLPVRAATRDGGDTVGFRYEEWEAPMRSRTREAVAQQRIGEARSTLAVVRRNVEQQRTINAQRGWSDATTCSAISVPSRSSLTRPADVLDRAQHDNAARLACVGRIRSTRESLGPLEANLKGLLASIPASDRAEVLTPAREDAARIFFGAPRLLPEFVDLFDQIKTNNPDRPLVRTRETQVRQFQRDWREFGASATDRGLLFGSIGWPASVRDIGLQALGTWVAGRLEAPWIVAGIEQTLEAAESLVAASLDAYNGCLEDAMKQLDIKLRAWESEVEAAPAFESAAHDFLVRECTQGVETLARAEADVQSWEQELARAEAAARDSSSAATAPSGRDRELNFVTCAAP